MTTDTTIKAVRTLHENGLTRRMISDALDISLSRVGVLISGKSWAEYQREWRVRNPVRFKEHKYRYKLYSRQNYLNGVKTPKRVVTNNCEVCGGKAVKLYYHHWDDSNTLLGMWLCYSCHRVAEYVDSDVTLSLADRYKLVKQAITCEFDIT